MKTAISLPDSIFEEAEALARELGVSRSELYTKAKSFESIFAEVQPESDVEPTEYSLF